MIVVRATKTLLDRVGPTVGDAHGTGKLGDWFVKPLFWRPQVALFVDARTRFPVLVPLAPARAVIERIPDAFGVLARHVGAANPLVDEEVEHMRTAVVAATNDRSVLGTMNEFAHLADAFRAGRSSVDLVDVALWLARTPCRPLYKTTVSPDGELLRVLGSEG